MLTKWGVSNFKAISTTRIVKEDENETDELELKPLTIFCGANSSGKSSLLQSILLMAQTMRHPNKKLPLILNGEFTSLGTFDDIKSLASDYKDIKIRFTYEPINKKLYEFSFDEHPIYGTCNIHPDLLARITHYSFSADFCHGKNGVLPELSYHSFSISLFFDPGDDEHLKSFCDVGDSEDITLSYFSNKPEKTDSLHKTWGAYNQIENDIPS